MGLKIYTSDKPIPFDFMNEPKFFIDDGEKGLDFGVIALRSTYVNLLKANGIVTLFENGQIHQPAVVFNAYFMLGLPTELISHQISHDGYVSVTPTLINVRRLESPPVGTRQTAYPRFVGQLDPELPFKSIDGMSGGPIFGIDYGPPMRYWVVALQSSWLKSQRIVFACSLPIFAKLCIEELDLVI